MFPCTFSCVTALLCLLWSNIGHAQYETSSPAETSAARELAYLAKTQYEDEDYAQAASNAEAAYRLVPAPTLALLAARSKVALGQWNAAMVFYRAAFAPTSLRQTTALVRAQQVAQEELVALQKRMPLVRVRVPESDATGTVTIDATIIPESTFDIWFPYDPGEHTLTWKSDRGEEISQKVRFSEGKRENLRVIVTPTSAGRNRERAFGVAGLGAGVLGLGLGVGFGVAENSTASTVSYIVGLSAAAAGGYLLWHSSRPEESLDLRLSAAAQSLRLSGTF